MKRIFSLLLLAAAAALAAESPVAVPESAKVRKGNLRYLTGGPLAGVELPWYPVYHGEEPGSPGGSSRRELQLYPGAVEHFRLDEIRFFGTSRSLFDIQSMLYRFNAPEIPGAAGKPQKFAQPVNKICKYGGVGKNAGVHPTGKFEPAVPVLETAPGKTILNGSFKLKQGMYCLRLIAAVRTQDQKTMVRKPLFADFSVSGAVDYKISRRMNYMDQFYSIGEFFFHAPKDGVYSLRLASGKTSQVNILVQSVILDDALTGVDFRAIKHKTAYDNPVPAEEVARIKEGIQSLSREERRKLEDLAWNSVLPLDCQCWWSRTGDNGTKKYFFYGIPAELLKDTSGLEIDKTFNAVTVRSFTKKYGQWRWRSSGFYNDKLNLTYSVKDYLAGKPVPAPYPLQFGRLGLAASRDNNSKLVYFHPFDGALDRSRNQWYYDLKQGGYFDTIAKGGEINARKFSPEKIYADLISFARLAYDYPMLDMTMNENAHLLLAVGPWHRGSLHHRTTYANYLAWYTEYQFYMVAYDKLFPLIQGNRELAAAIGRFVPWVKTPEDVIKLFDSYMVQDIVKKCMRHQYYTMPGSVLTALRVLNYDKKLADDFAAWTFSADFRYPVYGGLNYIMQNNLDRAGTAPSSSSFYAIGECGINFGSELINYSLASGERKYQFQDVKRYPKFHNTVYWCLGMLYAGCQIPRIGDVSGPDRTYDSFLKLNESNYRNAWKFWQDPASAAILHYCMGYQDPGIVRAAKKFTRMPYLTQPSRMIPNWCGILETGKRHDDFRYRRGVVVRAGKHYGHSHEDSLDLQFSAHGLLMLTDGGQRPGYASPNSLRACVHNTVTSAEKTINRMENACISAITDSEHYASLTARTDTGRSIRQVALADVNDEGPAVKLPITQQIPGAKLPRAAKTPDGYVFDVFREKTQGTLLYNFHTACDEAENFKWNVPDEQPDSKPVHSQFKRMNFRGTAPEYLTAQWKIRRTKEMENGKQVNSAYEPFLMMNNYDPSSPAKFVKLHLLNLSGKDFVQRAQYNDHYRGHRMTMLSATAKSVNGHAFVAVIEPFAGTPFIRQITKMTFDKSTNSWDDPVGVKVETADGQTHWNLSYLPGRGTAKSGEFELNGSGAFIAADAQGLKRAVLTGGTLLKSPLITIQAEKSAYTGKIIKVDYLENTATLDTQWQLDQIRLPKVIHIENDSLNTSFTVVSAENKNGKTVLHLKEAASLYVSDIDRIENDRVYGKQPAFAGSNFAGCTFTNAKNTKFWKLEEDGLHGDSLLEMESFEPEKTVHCWNYGPGDQVTLETSVIVERQADGTFKTVSDTPCRVNTGK